MKWISTCEYLSHVLSYIKACHLSLTYIILNNSVLCERTALPMSMLMNGLRQVMGQRT